MKAFSTATNAVIAIVAGVLVLLGYFLPGIFGDIQNMLLQWGIILAAFALLVGIANLVSVHWKKARAEAGKGVYSFILIVFFFLTLVVVGISGPTGFWSMWLFNNIQVPVESSLMALLAIVLIYASIRLVRRRPNSFVIVFMIAALIILLGTAPLYVLGDVPLLSELRGWIMRVPVVAGARGLLLGVALGALAAGMRILMGADRPYGG